MGTTWTTSTHQVASLIHQGFRISQINKATKHRLLTLQGTRPQQIPVVKKGNAQLRSSTPTTYILPTYYLPTTYLLPTYYLPTTYLLPTYYLHTTYILPTYYLRPTYYLPTTYLLPTYLPT